MNPIAIFYHVRLNGSGRNIVESKATPIMEEQMFALEASELLPACQEFRVNYHDEERDSVMAKALAGSAAIFTVSPDSGKGFDGELPTFAIMQDWLKTHQDWNVFYFHTKGVSKPDDPLRNAWRRCMTRATVSNWRTCVKALEDGFDMAGAHWLTPAKYPGVPHLVRPIWGGNFWWATSNYLRSLPPLIRQATPEIGLDGWMAENWVGLGKNPKVLDLAPHWPDLSCCLNYSIAQ